MGAGEGSTEVDGSSIRITLLALRPLVGTRTVAWMSAVRTRTLSTSQQIKLRGRSGFTDHADTINGEDLR